MDSGAGDRVSLADVKRRLSEVIDGVEAEHNRVVITRHGKPAAVLIAPEDLEALEATLDLLGDPEAIAALRRATEDVEAGDVEYLSREAAQARWIRD